MDLRFDIDRRQAKAGEPIGLPRKVDVVVFELGGPIAADRGLDAGADGPADMVLLLGCEDIAVGIEKIDLGLAPGKTGCRIRQPRSDSVADAPARGGEIVEGGMVRISAEARGIRGADEARIDFGAEHDIVVELPVIAALIAADQAGRCRWGKDALQRLWISIRAELCAAIAHMGADIEAAPVVCRLRPRLHGQIGSYSDTAKSEHADRSTDRHAIRSGISQETEARHAAPPLTVADNGHSIFYESSRFVRARRP